MFTESWLKFITKLHNLIKKRFALNYLKKQCQDQLLKEWLNYGMFKIRLDCVCGYRTVKNGQYATTNCCTYCFRSFVGIQSSWQLVGFMPAIMRASRGKVWMNNWNALCWCGMQTRARCWGWGFTEMSHSAADRGGCCWYVSTSMWLFKHMEEMGQGLF